jgi:hypothetical protein
MPCEFCELEEIEGRLKLVLLEKVGNPLFAPLASLCSAFGI